MRNHLLSIGFLFASTTVPLYAQQSEDTSQNQSSEEFHYRDGAYGYRAEAQLMDSLAILEMMGELTATEVQQEQDKFRKAKKDKQRAKKEKMRKQRKKKDKKS